MHDVTVIVSNISHNRRPEDNRIKEFIARSHPDVNVKVNFEMEGLEAPVVILVHNGEHLGSSISLGVSRATTKLIIMCSDDNNILNKGVEKGLLNKLETIGYDKVPEDSNKARWSFIGSALHSLHGSIPGYLQKRLRNFLNNQAR